MRRYRPSKPSRREVRAALEFYKPHDFDGGAMPESAIEHPEIYKPCVCWWTFKGRKPDIVQHICGLPATLYKIEHTGVNISFSYTSASMYLCDKHVKALRGKGYAATLVTAPP